MKGVEIDFDHYLIKMKMNYIQGMISKVRKIEV